MEEAVKEAVKEVSATVTRDGLTEEVNTRRRRRRPALNLGPALCVYYRLLLH